MIDTIMFDLDGTLLPLTQQKFIGAYFDELSKVFVRLELEPERAIGAVWAGTKAMVLNDGTVLNARRFWESFEATMDISGERLAQVEAACDSFYANEFDTVKRILKPDDAALPRRMIDMLKAKGYDMVLATNPLFPTVAVTTRLGWINLKTSDFSLITDYTNSSFSKPNPEYYREILRKIGKDAQQCLMVGNNAREDMAAATLGADTYLVTDCLENEGELDISGYRSGTLAQLEEYLAALPSIA